MIRYIHGSDDSRDLDTMYVFDKIPTKQEANMFCGSKKDVNENANVIVIEDGKVIWTLKGLASDVNNGVFSTYKLHEQEFPLIINDLVAIDEILYDLSVLRFLLSNFSRTKYREVVKKAMKSNFTDKMSVIKSLDYVELFDIEFTASKNRQEIFKSSAFQMAKGLAFKNNKHLYTKKDIVKEFPELKNLIYFLDYTMDDIKFLDSLVKKYIDELDKYNIQELNNNITYFVNENRYINTKIEEEVFLNE